MTELTSILRSAAEAALSVLPVPETVVVGVPTEGPVTVPPGAAVCVPLTGAHTGTLLVAVGQELVDALRASPLGELDLATALGPALSAAAAVLGGVAGTAAERPVDQAFTVPAGGRLLTVPLTAGGTRHAVIGFAGPGAAPLSSGAAVGARAGLPARPGGNAMDMLHGVEMDVTVELGRARMTVRELLSLTTGSAIELDRIAGSPADVLVNGRLIARGEVVVIDENFGVRITEILGAEHPEEARA
jgi:flagellar motor switch protein FliN